MNGVTPSVSPTLTQLSLLQMVQYHAETGGEESEKILSQIAQRLTHDTNIPIEIQPVLNKIRVAIDTKEWDPTLAQTCSEALATLSRDFAKTARPAESPCDMLGK